MANQSNQNQIFTEIVSFQAWHDEFTEQNSRASLFADVVFGEAKMGVHPNEKVTFRLSIKRAEVFVIINDREPARFDPNEVERFIRERKIQQTIRQEKERYGSLGANVGGGVDGIKVPSIKASGEAKGELKTSHSEVTERSEELSLFEITHFPTSLQNHRWVIKHLENEALAGPPWDPIETPLVTVVDERQGKKSRVSPSIRIVVECLREDLVITDIRVKEPEKVKGWKLGKRMEDIDPANMRAAETVIRNRLTEFGLEAGELSEDFSRIVLGSISAQALAARST